MIDRQGLPRARSAAIGCSADQAYSQDRQYADNWRAIMFLRCKVRRKDGKQHRYWSVVENTRVARGAWCSGTCCIWVRSIRNPPAIPVRPPMRRNRSAFPFAEMAGALGASRSSPHASPNCCRPLLAQRRALDPSSLALSSNPAKQRGPLPGHSIGPRGWSAPSALGRRWISS